LSLDIVPSVCPHDCPSACALDVERIDGRIGRIRGAATQSYTRGVVCAKVARYAERQHHPARLSQPLRRVGEKGVGRDAFRPISWEEALDEVAEALTRAAQRHGSEAVWPYYYCGTMGLVQGDGINRDTDGQILARIAHRMAQPRRPFSSTTTSTLRALTPGCRSPARPCRLMPNAGQTTG